MVGAALVSAATGVAANLAGADHGSALAACLAGGMFSIGAVAAILRPLGVMASALRAYAADGDGERIPATPPGSGRFETAVVSNVHRRMKRKIDMQASRDAERRRVDERIGMTLGIMQRLPDPTFWIMQARGGAEISWANDSAAALGAVMDGPAPDWLGEPFSAGTVEASFRAPDGREIHYEFAKTIHEPGKGANGRSTIVVVGRDVSDRRRREEEARMKAISDPLTGLLNRAGFKERIKDAVAQGPFSVLYIDLDKFKPVNDTHGHAAGDELLRQVAVRMRGCGAIPFRLGGDEFAFLAPGAGVEEAERIALAVLAECGRPFDLVFREADAERNVRVKIGASVGCACLPLHAGNADDLLAAADAAMYECKKAGRNCHRFPPDE